MANTVDAPRIFQPEGLHLPPFLRRTLDGQLVIDKNYAGEGARLGPYDTVMDFGTSRANLRGLVPEEERLTANNRNLNVLGFWQPEIREAMDTITDLANDPSRSSENPDDRREYREHLAVVYKAMAKEVDDWVFAGGDSPLIFAPKNGGVFVQEVFEEKGHFFPTDFFNYRMSRVQDKDSGLMVGITYRKKENPEISTYRRFVFADDCMASDISAYATMEMIREALVKARVPLSQAEVLIAVSAATQRGLESLLSPRTKFHFGFESIRAITGVLAYQMDGHFYLQHSDGRYVVGDMGNWTQPPTE